MSWQEYHKAGATEREARALAMRDDGMIFRKIGEALGVSSVRANELVWSAKRALEYSKTWRAGLSPRVINCLARAGYVSKSGIVTGVQRGEIYPGFIRGYGVGAHAELLCWMGDAGAIDIQKPALNSVANAMYQIVGLTHSFTREDAKREAQSFVAEAIARAMQIKAELEAAQ